MEIISCVNFRTICRYIIINVHRYCSRRRRHHLLLHSFYCSKITKKERYEMDSLCLQFHCVYKVNTTEFSRRCCECKISTDESEWKGFRLLFLCFDSISLEMYSSFTNQRNTWSCSEIYAIAFRLSLPICLCIYLSFMHTIRNCLNVQRIVSLLIWKPIFKFPWAQTHNCELRERNFQKCKATKSEICQTLYAKNGAQKVWWIHQHRKMHPVQMLKYQLNLVENKIFVMNSELVWMIHQSSTARSSHIQ